MSDEELKKRRNVELQNEAALIIQKHWREYLQQREDSQESMKAMMQEMQQGPSEQGTSPPSSAAASNTGAAAESIKATLLQEYEDLLAQRAAILRLNIAYQNRIACHLAEQRTRKGEGADSNELTAPEEERQYWELLSQLHQSKTRLLDKRQAAVESLRQQQERYHGIINDVLAEEANFREFIREVSQHASFTHSNQHMNPQDVNNFLQNDEKQRHSIRKARIRYLQLKNEAKRLRQLASQGTGNGSSEGMYLIDLEQLKIENINLNEKIEERSSDIAKLRRKVTTTVHVLTHMREKLEFKREENTELRLQVATVEEELSGVRDLLAQSKKRRDEFLNSNLRMREKMPLVGSENLLMDYEQRKSRINECRIRVVELTNTHSRLTKQIKKYSSNVEELTRELIHYPTIGLTAH